MAGQGLGFFPLTSGATATRALPRLGLGGTESLSCLANLGSCGCPGAGQVGTRVANQELGFVWLASGVTATRALARQGLWRQDGAGDRSANPESRSYLGAGQVGTRRDRVRVVFG